MRRFPSSVAGGFRPANALRAANDVRFTMFVGIGSMIAFRILGSWILCVKMEWGAMGVWDRHDY